jgi:hypothetical protein
MLGLWALTLFDWFKSVIEEQLDRGTDMTRTKFFRFSGWALILAAVVLIVGFGIGGGETSYDDPLGGPDRIYEYSQLIFIPTSLLLYTIGMLGLRARYGNPTGWLGKTSLTIAAFAAGLSCLSAIPLFALIDDTWLGQWWNLMVYSLLAMLIALSLFGVSALSTRPFPHWNGLPLLTAIWFPLVFIIGTIVDIAGGNTDGIDDYLAFVALLFMVVGSVALGYMLQKELPADNPGNLVQA